MSLFRQALNEARAMRARIEMACADMRRAIAAAEVAEFEERGINPS